MNPLETIAIYGVIPAAVLGLLAAATLMRPGSGRGARYRSGGSWDHEPQWWMGNPSGSGVPGPDPAATASPDPGTSAAAPRRTARGGARGTW